MSSCLRGGGRPYGLDPDIIRPSSSSSLSISGRSLQSFSPSSTLSESGNSPCTISIKRARAPRKRLNQTYNEAAALLSTVYPNVFPIESLKRPLTKANHFHSFDESPALLPSFPVLEDDAYLIREGSQERPGYLFELKAASPVENSCSSPTSNEFGEPGSPSPLDEDFDTESILDVDIGEGIDSIMGSHRYSTLTKSTNSDTSEEKKTNNFYKCPFLQGLIGLQLGSKLEYGLGLGYRKNFHHTALRQRDSSEWWRCPFVPVHEIAPKLNQSIASAPSLDKKKKKKKAKNKEEIAVQGMHNNPSTTRTSTVKATDAAATMANTTTTITFSLQEMMKDSGLGLKLNHEEVIKAWSGQSWMLSDGQAPPNSSAEAHTKLADINLIVDGSGAGGVREASVLRYKEKRKTRLFSKKIRYQVRKMNADMRPRLKGKFVRRPAPPQQAIDEES